jgi:hypothetical protein
MYVYLPIAEMPINAALVIAISAAIGFLSGLVGVGGGFIMTPALMLMGVPPAIAAATEASQITATSVSGVVAHSRRRGVDIRLGLLLTIGGVIGSTLGVLLFATLQRQGQIDIFITILYVIFLTAIGALMLWESVRALRRKARNVPIKRKKRTRSLLQQMPFRLRFPRSRLYISVIPVIAIGLLTGLLAALMGVGGGFIMVPAMIYLLRVPANVAIGTSLFNVLIVTALVTVLQATQTQSVDLFLAMMLIAGGVVGAQLGVRFGARLQAEQLRASLGVVLFATGLWLLWSLIVTPNQFFILGPA